MAIDERPAATASDQHPHEPGIPPALDAEGRCLVCGLLVARDELLELLADLAMEGKILGLGDPVAEVNDQTGVLGRVRATLGSDFLEGR